MNWKRSTIGQIATVKGGKRVPKGYKLEDNATPHPYITVGDFTDTGTVDTSSIKYISPEVFQQISRYTISTADMYLSIAGTIGKTGFIPQKLDGANLTENACKLVFNEEVFGRYVYYFTKSDDFIEQAGLNTRVAAQPKLALTRLKSIPIPMPPLSEQKHIVAVLDDAFARIDAAIANTEKNIANVRELFESYLNGVFEQKGDEWEDTCVEKLCDSIIDCINKTAPKVDEETPFKMLRTTNIRNGLVNINNVKHVTEEVYHAWTRRQIPVCGDVLLTREAPMGEVGLLLTDEKVFLGQRIVSYRVNSIKLDNRFLLYAFQSSFLQQQMKKVASGSTVQHIRVPDTKKWIIPTPSLEQQTVIADNLDRLKEKKQNVESLYQQKLTALHELKQSILQKAFSGELTANMKFDEQVA